MARSKKKWPAVVTAVQEQYSYPIKATCKVLSKSPQAYYKHLKSATPLQEAELEFMVTSYIMEARKSNPGIGGVSLWKQYCREWGDLYPIGRDKFARHVRKYKLYVRIPRRYTAPLKKRWRSYREEAILKREEKELTIS